MPLLAIGFLNPEAGRSIFQAWRKKFGEVDERDEIAISVVTGRPGALRSTLGRS
jgi:hypothetical protein